MAELSVEMRVNGRKVTRQAKAHWRLLDFLREELHLTGSKEGCGAGECGTCSVFVDGKLIKSCLLPLAKAQGADIQTVEGLSDADELTPIQRAFHKTGASQCGYCIPGMVMASTAALRDNPHAGQEEIRERIGGNICRCTGYQKIIEAVELARDVINGDLPSSAFDADQNEKSYIGSNVRRIDAPGKVTGALIYAADMTLPNMLEMKVLRSPHPHARILSIDTSAAEALEGVEGVITCDDVPGKDGFGVFIHDQPVMARGKVRYVGEAVAAVAAEDADTAKQALRLIKVVYQDLPGVFSPEEAQREGAPVLHDYAPDNLVKHIPIRKGDVERGFADADLILEHAFETQAVEHAYLEPEAGIAYVDADGVLTVHAPDQNITHHRHMLSEILARPINRIRLIMSPVGGGFGGKEDMIYQGMLALMTLKTRRPVRMVSENSAPGAHGVHPRGVDHCELQTSPGAYKLQDGADPRRPYPGLEVESCMRRGRLRDVDRRCDAEDGDPGGRPLRHPEPAGGHLRHLYQQYAERRVPHVRRHADAVRHRVDARPGGGETGHGPVRAALAQQHAGKRHHPYPPAAEFGQLPAGTGSRP